MNTFTANPHSRGPTKSPFPTPSAEDLSMTRSLDRGSLHRFMEHSAHLDRGDRHSPALTIQISTGVGGASTPLAAFDAALCEMGVGNFNLLQLSSVIPPGTTMRHVDRG